MHKKLTSPAQIRKIANQKIPLHENPIFASYDFNKTFPSRFWRMVKFTDTCWMWTGYLNACGYGVVILRRGKTMLCNRASWVLCNGPIPSGKQILHRCDNPACVNPAHLFIGTHVENMQDRQDKGRTPKGEHSGSHKLTTETVLKIREEYASGTNRCQLSRKYHTSKSNVFSIVHRLSWRHI